ncbi:MAG: glycosyltransferase family 2 protein [Sulfuricurvum sp.]|nr:glycosyltransferase family 2 protein [Sulfuricurvum sp.]
MKISICIPVYNGAMTITALVEEVKKTLHKYEFEIILINDGSKDNSEEVCVNITKQYDFVKFIALRKNFGEHNAVICGLNYATGDYTVIIDDDFQNPPSEILALIDEANKGYDVVYSRYEEKKHHWFRNLGSKFNDLVATWLLDKPNGLYLSSFKLIRKEVVEEIVKYKGPFPYIDGLILRVTDNIGTKTVEHTKRVEGESNYTLSKLISLWLNMFVNFSIKPLRIATVVGVAISVCSFILGIYFIVEKLLLPDASLGWTSLMVSILFLSGIQLIFLGIIGEYLGKQYLDQNGTPQWVIKKEYL